MGLWNKIFISKKYLPEDIIYNCIETYEKNDIFLEKNSYYYEEKQKLCKSKVSHAKFKEFVDHTKGSVFTSFNMVSSRDIKNIRLYTKSTVYDIFFNKFLYVKPDFWDKNCFVNFSKIVYENSTYPFLIIDLRDSSGGYIKTCINICNIFLHDCEIVKLIYKNKKVSYYANENNFKFKKIFIIVNNNTMSSAEILAYSLKVNLKEALILGEDTFNKNFGQLQLINKKYRYVFSIPTFFWDVCGEYDKTITYLPRKEIFDYIFMCTCI